MHPTEADRILAARHVAEGERRVAQQRKRIEVNRSKGFPVHLSEGGLATMLVTLAHMRASLALIEAGLAASRALPTTRTRPHPQVRSTARFT